MYLFKTFHGRHGGYRKFVKGVFHDLYCMQIPTNKIRKITEIYKCNNIAEELNWKFKILYKRESGDLLAKISR